VWNARGGSYLKDDDGEEAQDPRPTAREGSQFSRVLTATLSFAAAASLLVLAPGPDTLLVLRNSLSAGRRRGLVTITGIVSGLLVWATIAAIGLAALLRASEVGYTIVRVAGATYLIAFGVRLIVNHRNDTGKESIDRVPAPRSAKSTLSAYLSGLATNLLNPKVGIFFISFLPVFIPKGASVGWTSALFAAIFIAEGTAWLLAIVFFASRLGEAIRRPKVRRRLEGLSGVVMIGFGIRLATEAR
jgi:threonine/homoserine/homoserine lactone efflux protein